MMNSWKVSTDDVNRYQMRVGVLYNGWLPGEDWVLYDGCLPDEGWTPQEPW